ncbi:MAG: trypsin-like serine peptidase, partial [Actinomycetes bacterium]
MRRSRTAVLAALTAVLGGVLAVGASPGAASGGSGVATHRAATTEAEQDRVATYWTAGRMRTAQPADRPTAANTTSTTSTTSTTVHRGQATTVTARRPGGAPVPAASVVNTTGKVFFTLGGVNYVCSGAATASTNKDVVTTAGHCVNEGPGAYATNWAFVPAYNNGARPYGTWTARTLVTTTAWASQGDINYDGGFAVMNTLNGQHLTDVVGGQGVAFNQPRGLFYDAYGYPAAGKFNGETLKSCSGTAQDDIYGGTQSQSIACNMTGGSSGGPWLTGGSTINSVNSFGYRGVKNRMFGPYFGSAIQSAYT